MSELGELIEHARELQPRTFTPEPVGLARPRDAAGWRRRRILLDLQRDLELARITRPEWYVWVTEVWPQSRPRNSADIPVVKQGGPFTA